MNVMRELGMIDRARPASRVTTVVEDPREQSGYLQINYPSPIDGVFEPAVSPGQRVERGQLVGQVCDPLSGETAEVPANETGLVVMLARRRG